MDDNRIGEIYFDHAATTPVDPLVLEAMTPFFGLVYGNPSMSYRQGSVAKMAIERARRSISMCLGGSEGNIFFTGGGTEGNNWALQGLVRGNGIRDVITSPLEHASVLSTLKALARWEGIQVHYVSINEQGEVDYADLELLLRRFPHALVSLMHGNNEIGNITDIVRVGLLCRQYGTLYHTDMVQTVGYVDLDLSSLPVDVCTGSAHKFYGPKGVGFLYLRAGVKIEPLLHGGGQERGLRGGTENVALIIGMAKALSLATADRVTQYRHVEGLKRYCIKKLERADFAVCFHGACSDFTKSLPHILNIGLPDSKLGDTLLLHLDIAGIAASAGSACMSGVSGPSHVLRALGVSDDCPRLRISFGRYNTREEILQLLKRIAS